MTTDAGLGGAETAGANGALGRAGALLLAAGIAFLLLNLWGYRHCYLDDAFISFRYSRNLALEGRLCWNPGGPPVAGFSNLLWVVLLAPFAAIGLPLLAVARGLSLAAALFTQVLLWRALDRADTDSDTRRFLAGAAAYWFLGNRSLAFHVMSGMETVFHACLVCVCALWVLRPPRDRRVELAGFLLSGVLVLLSRPEGIAIVLLVGLVRFLDRRTAGRVFVPLAFIGVYLVYLGWHTWLFSTPLPNSFYVKLDPGHDPLAGARYLARFLLENGLLLAVAAPALVARPLRASAVVVAFHAAFALAILPLMGSHHRFVYPCFWAVVLAAAVSTGRQAMRLRSRPWPAVAVVLLLVPFSLASFRLGWFALQGQYGFVMPGELSEHVKTEIGKTLRRWDLPRRPVLAYGDAGVVPYFSDFEVIDDVGLNDLAIARERDPERILAYILSRRPDLALIPMSQPTARLEDTFPSGHGPLGPHQRRYHEALLEAGFRSAAVIECPGYHLNVLVNERSELAGSLRRYIEAAWP